MASQVVSYTCTKSERQNLLPDLRYQELAGARDREKTDFDVTQIERIIGISNLIYIGLERSHPTYVCTAIKGQRMIVLTPY